MKDKLPWIIGGILLGGLGVAALKKRDEKKLGKEEAINGGKIDVRGNTAQTAHNQNGANAGSGPRLEWGAGMPVTKIYKSNAEGAALKSRDVFAKLSREWPGLAQLAEVFEASNLPAALDLSEPKAALSGTTFEETDLDQTALAAGIAVRFHPDLFTVVTSMNNHKGGPPPKNARRIWIDKDGRWYFWKGSKWQEIMLAPSAYATLDWDSLIIPETFEIHAAFKRALPPQKEADWIRNELEKANTEEGYVPKPPPVRALNPETGGYDMRDGFPPGTFFTIEQAFPSGLARGDSDRIVRSIMVRTPDGTIVPAQSGPSMRAQELVRELFEVGS